MRIYTNAKEALSEIQRDLAEMGIHNHAKTYQDKNIEDKPEFDTMELQNYMYSLVNPQEAISGLNPTQPWACQEFRERFFNPDENKNPGEAWLSRKEVWEPFLNSDGKFSYTYSERINYNDQFTKLMTALAKDKNSRQIYLSIWSADDTDKLGGISRVPCSLGYYFQIRKGALHMTYLQRSCDFITHFQNDVWLAVEAQQMVAHLMAVPVGTFTHWIGSLHVFKKDIKGTY